MMSNEDLKNYYADLLIMQYRSKPKARKTIKMMVDFIIMNQLPLQIQDAFNVNNAVGVQLDVVGKYVGASRYGYKFAADPSDPPVPVTLNDDEFRTYIELNILLNAMGSSTADIQMMIDQYFQGALLFFDTQAMLVSYFYTALAGDNIMAEFFVLSGKLPYPMAVGAPLLTYAPGNPTFFGFVTYSNQSYNNHGFNTYDDYDDDCPFLSYENAINI